MVVTRCSLALMPLAPLGRQQLPAVMSRHRQIENVTGLDRCGKPHRHELLGVTDATALGQHQPPRTGPGRRDGA